LNQDAGAQMSWPMKECAPLFGSTQVTPAFEAAFFTTALSSVCLSVSHSIEVCSSPVRKKQLSAFGAVFGKMSG
jgi:hypothetical protein